MCCDVTTDVSEHNEKNREQRGDALLGEKAESKDVIERRQQNGAGRQIREEVVNAERNLVQASGLP